MIRKIILIILCSCAVSWSGLRIYQQIALTREQNLHAENHIPDTSETLALTTTVTLVPTDIDAMAERMPKHHDIYLKLRDQSLAVFAKRHPQVNASDPISQAAIRLAVYLSIWDDFYGENLWLEYGNLISRIQDRDPLLMSLYFKNFYEDNMSSSDNFQGRLISCVEDLEQSDYSVYFKLSAYTVLLKDIASVKSNPKYWNAMPKCQALLPQTIDKASRCFSEYLKENPPHDELYRKGMALSYDLRDDGEMINTLSEKVDSAFQSEAPDHPTRPALRGRFLIDYAWSARGSGWSQSVTQEGWKLFGERLQQAASTLESAYVKYPEEEPISRAMLTVERGQGQGKDRFDMWFARAITLAPDNFDTYRSKHLYLLARWYGSDKQGFEFGLECVKTQNWNSKIPLILTMSLRDTAGRNPKIYTHPAIWSEAEKVYRTYLQHFPKSDQYRSEFARAAALGEHWEIAEEQFTLLGNRWYRNVFRDGEYASLRKSVKDHLAKP